MKYDHWRRQAKCHSFFIR